MRTFLTSLFVVGVLGLLSACAVAPPGAAFPGAALPGAAAGAGEAPTVQAATEKASTPELTLNLATGKECQCVSAPSRDYTFLERGYRALSEGDPVAALQHFQRYKRLEVEPAAQWEADIAIAYLGMLPDSPFYDHDAAEETFRRLVAQLKADMHVHPTALLMRDSLGAFALLNRHIDDLESSNATLREDLQTREEAIKRLRELTLGPSRAAQP